MKHKIAIALLIIAVGISTLLWYDTYYFSFIILGIIIVFGLTLSAGVLFMKFNYFLENRTKSNSDKVILSFDDGPDSVHTLEILTILKKHAITAFFFVIGEKAEKNPEIIQQIHAEGHIIGNHTYSHLNLFSMQSGKKVQEEIEKCDNVIRSILNQETRFFRPPIGYTNPIIARVLKKLKKQSIGWELRSYDSVLTKPEALKERLLNHIKPSQIVLLHDNLPQSAAMLDEFILEAQKNGIIFANREELLKIN